jgi:hypothetical protein
VTGRPGAFDSDLSIQAAGPVTWRLIAPLIWTGTQGDAFVVHLGFTTDLASVPRFLHWLVLPYGPYTRAAVLHDYLIHHRINHDDPRMRVTSRDVDGIFRRVMQDLGVPWIKRWAMWTGVRWSSLTTENRRYGRDFRKDAPRVIGITLLAIPVILPGVVGVLISLGIVRLFTRERPTDMTTLFNRYPVARDIAERVLATFIMTLLALATADGVGWDDWADWGHWQTWAVSAIAACLSLLKGLVAARIGKNPSASLDPAVKLQPTTASQPTRHGPDR